MTWASLFIMPVLISYNFRHLWRLVITLRYVLDISSIYLLSYEFRHLARALALLSQVVRVIKKGPLPP